ncbi:probable vacuolar protein 8 [Coccomyxa sp. Obi]|nr:probable vacuolar protein 8 [Coccomyxa sp. Obi]
MSNGSDTGERKGHKRKLADALTPPAGCSTEASTSGDAESILSQVCRLVEVIKSFTSRPPDNAERLTLRRAAHGLAELSKTESNVDQVVAGGAVEAVVPLLTHFPGPDADPLVASGEEVEKEACFILGLLAIKQEHQHAIADQGALPGLVGLLKRYVPFSGPPNPGASVVRRAADAITNLAHENVSIKSRVRTEGGIPPLVALLDSYDAKVQRAAAGALRTLAFKNEDNKNQIVECGALPTLIHMLRAQDAGIHYEAVGVIGNLVHSSIHIKRTVLEEGALQPVIGLLSSSCTESQRESALLLGQFATTEPDYKAKIVQRGAVPPLIEMLGSSDVQLKEMAAFALGRLAQNSDNQAGIVQAGGLPNLLELMASRNGNLQHNAAFALYGLADNEDNIAAIVREGGVQCLQDCELLVQPSKDCVQKTLKRLEDKIQGKVLNQIMYSMNTSDRIMQHRTSTALARLGREQDLKTIFIDRKGLDILIAILTDPSRDPTTLREAAGALFELAKKANATAPIDCAPAPPTPQVYLGEQYVNNPTLSDVTFMVEGRKFHAHRIALLASSDTFRAMFDGHYKEKEASTIPIPNIRWTVFESMMRCIYTGSVEVTPDIAEELLKAADQYMLEGLKRLCEAAISTGLCTDNLASVHDLSENYNAPQLARRCVLYSLEHYEEMVASCQPGQFAGLLHRMVPKLRESLVEQLLKKETASV